MGGRGRRARIGGAGEAARHSGRHALALVGAVLDPRSLDPRSLPRCRLGLISAPSRGRLHRWEVGGVTFDDQTAQVLDRVWDSRDEQVALDCYRCVSVYRVDLDLGHIVVHRHIGVDLRDLIRPTFPDTVASASVARPPAFPRALVMLTFASGRMSLLTWNL